MLQGHQVTVEITSGQTYRGKLIEGARKKEEGKATQQEEEG